MLKKKIEELINAGGIEEADDILIKYEHLFKEDSWLLTTKSVIHLLSEKILKDGLKQDPFNGDMLFNLGYVYEQKKEYQTAYDYYLNAKNTMNERIKIAVINAIQKLENNFLNLIVKEKISIFVKPGLDNFIDDIISGLRDNYNVRKILVTSYNQIDCGMDWADICWFEWCDELIIYASKLVIAREKKSYVVYTVTKPSLHL